MLALQIKISVTLNKYLQFYLSPVSLCFICTYICIHTHTRSHTHTHTRTRTRVRTEKNPQSQKLTYAHHTQWQTLIPKPSPPLIRQTPRPMPSTTINWLSGKAFATKLRGQWATLHFSSWLMNTSNFNNWSSGGYCQGPCVQRSAWELVSSVSSSSAFQARSLGFTIFGWDFCVCGRFFNPTIDVVTFCLHQVHEWCMLGVFVLPAFTCKGHQCQDLLNPHKEMHACTD